MRTLLPKILYSILFLFFITKINASTYLINASENIFQFEEQVEVFQEINTDISIQNIESQTFQPYQIWKDRLVTGQIYWGKFQIKNEASNGKIIKDWVMTFPLILTNIDVYIKYPNGTIISSKTGFFLPPSQRTFAPIIKGNLVELEIRKDQIVTVYFKVKNERKNSLPEFNIRITSDQHFFNTLSQQKQNRGLFIGFVLMMLVYNLFLFFFDAKDKAYLYYSIYLLGIVIFSLYNTGDLADKIHLWFFPNDPRMIYFFKPTVYFAMLSYVTFLRIFLDLKNLLFRWEMIFKYFSLFLMSMFFVDVFLLVYSNFNPNIADFSTVSTAFIFLFIVFTFSWFLFKTKDKKGYFIVAGTIFMGIGIFISMVDRLNTLEYSTFYFRVGTILEIIIFSLGLAYRRNGILKEKQSAFFELERNKIIQDQERKEALRLKELDELKSKLYTNITHEFRTPLTVIMGMTESINGHEQEKKLISRNSNQLLRLINQVLDLSKIEKNLIQIHWVQNNIVVFLQYLTESFHSMAKSKDISLTFYAEEENILMDFDEEKIEHLTYNLISNAIKFTPSGGKIVFHINEITINKTRHLQIKIKDSGIGISKENLPFIFDRFYQSKDKQLVKGTGIGLALVKEIIDLFKGNISVKSSLGTGSEFVIQLPITQNAKIVKPTILTQDNNEESQLPLNPKDEVFNPDLPILLLIEDNTDVSNYIQNILVKDYNIRIAYDGEKGIATAFDIIPDIIISDVMMPLKNGFEVTQLLKNDERTSHIPIILLTAKVNQEDKITGLKSGADAYLLKPFHKEELLIRLKQLHLQRKQLIQKFDPKLLNKVQKNSPSPSVIDNKFLQRITDFINKNIDDPNLNVDRICKLTKLSKNQLYRKFKALTGLPPSTFIRTIRLNKANHLLKTTNSNISEIAYQVGFNDPNYFSRVFHKEFGITPREVTNN